LSTYQKEAFDITQHFRPTWEKFMGIKPESVSKAEFIRQAIEAFVEQQERERKKE